MIEHARHKPAAAIDVIVLPNLARARLRRPRRDRDHARRRLLGRRQQLGLLVLWFGLIIFLFWFIRDNRRTETERDGEPKDSETAQHKRPPRKSREHLSG